MNVGRSVKFDTLQSSAVIKLASARKDRIGYIYAHKNKAWSSHVLYIILSIEELPGFVATKSGTKYFNSGLKNSSLTVHLGPGLAFGLAYETGPPRDCPANASII